MKGGVNGYNYRSRISIIRICFRQSMENIKKEIYEHDKKNVKRVS